VAEIRLKRDLFENVEISSLLRDYQNFMRCFLLSELLTNRERLNKEKERLEGTSL